MTLDDPKQDLRDVIGGFAMQLLGSSYLTFDIDIAYDPARDNAELIATALRRFAPRARGLAPDLPFRFDAQMILSTEILTLTTSAGDVDLLGAVKGFGSYSELIALSEMIRFESFDIRVLGIDGLLRAKRAAARQKDAVGVIELEAMRELRNLLE